MFESFFKRFVKPQRGGKVGDFSKYTLLRTIGKGTMSVVFKARDRQGKTFAVKVLQPQSLELRRRIDEMRGNLTEGQLAFGFQHPNIVRTVDYGDVDKEKEFIAMELIEGVLLKNLIGTNVRELKKDPISIFLAIGDALSYIHKKGFIHRDFCPKNVFILRDGRVLLFDFGLTISIAAAKKTRGVRTGTASYMAPEIIRRSYTDERTDIYSFGVLMYEVMTGAKPFGGSGTIERMIQLLNTEPRDPKFYNPNIPDELCEIFMKCLEKDRSNRFQSVDGVLDRLRVVKETLSPGPSRSKSDTEKSVERNLR